MRVKHGVTLGSPISDKHCALQRSTHASWSLPRTSSSHRCGSAVILLEVSTAGVETWCWEIADCRTKIVFELSFVQVNRNPTPSRWATNLTEPMPSSAKQDPDEKARRAAAWSVASDGKIYFSCAQVASAVMACVPAVKEFKPDEFVAIGGGFIPARMLQTKVKKTDLGHIIRIVWWCYQYGQYDCFRKQWFDETPGTFGALVRGNVYWLWRGR